MIKKCIHLLHLVHSIQFHKIREKVRYIRNPSESRTRRRTVCLGAFGIKPLCSLSYIPTNPPGSGIRQRQLSIVWVITPALYADSVLGIYSHRTQTNPRLCCCRLFLALQSQMTSLKRLDANLSCACARRALCSGLNGAQHGYGKEVVTLSEHSS